MSQPRYTFLPYLRRGLVQRITEPDGFAATTSTGRQQLAAELLVGAHPIDGSPVQKLGFTKNLQLVGPGDVLTIKSSAFIGSVPNNGTNEFLADRFAFVELYEEDFPWRYTPAAPQNDRLRPWIFLLVLELTEFTESKANPLGPEYPPFIELKAASLPSPAEIYAWAHVQVASDLPHTTALETSPDACLARLISPRRLRPSTRYVGFVVPSFETGRRAAFERDGTLIATIPAQAPAWGAGVQTGLKLPYYYRFEFGTSAEAEFEELVRRLAPNTAVDALRGRPLNVTAPGFGLDGLAAQPTVLVEGALKPVAPPVASGVGVTFTKRLRDLLDAGDALADSGASTTAHPYEDAPGFPALFAEDPMVLPPIYGRWHAGGWRITDVAHAPSWISELNLDPRYRVAAGVGAAIVQDRDDELVERAFKQLQGIRELERARREADLAIAVGQSIFERHLQTADAERTMTATATMHGALRSTEDSTIKADVEASRVPRATMSAAFKRVVRPGGKLDRALGNGLRTALIDGVNTERLSASPPIPEPITAISAGGASSLIANATTKYRQDVAAIGRWVFAEAAVRTRLLRPGAPLDPQWRDAHRVSADAIIAAPPIGGSNAQAIRDRVTVLRDAIVSKIEGTQTVFHIATAVYKLAFGEVAGKIYRGVESPAAWVLFVSEGAAIPTEGIARMASPFDLATYQDAFDDFTRDIVEGREDVAVRPALAGTASVAQQIRDAVRPAQTVRKRVAARLVRTSPGARDDAQSVDAPIMAHPRFPDPLVDDVRRLANEHLIPNLSSLPDNSLTLLVPNAPFIESLLAGANHELARELLWREFPTDLRGSYFLNFWDAGDGVGGDDAPPLDGWTKPLGQNLNRTTTSVSVLVIRGALVRQFPNVVVYAQRAVRPAAGQPRRLSEAPADLRLPTLRAQLAADTLAVAFALDPAEAIGDPGWFLVFKERPGELGFGMDDGPPEALTTWDNLNFQHAGVAEGAHVSLATPVALVPADPQAATWGQTSADMADILFQLPFLMARHASELL